MFIVFEGIDGCGKSTQMRRLAERFEAVGREVLLTREPTSAAVGALLRRALVGEVVLADETLALLFAADRFQHVEDLILPALQAGKAVVCDRFYFSSFAYQGEEQKSGQVLQNSKQASGGAGLRVRQYNSAVMEVCPPDVVFFLDLPPEESMARIRRSRAGVEIFENVEKLRVIRENYLSLIEEFQPDDACPVTKIYKINAAQSEDIIADEVWSALNEFK